MHFKGFSIIKGSVILGWKLQCWFRHKAPSLSLSEHSSDDDTCSNHWVMSHLILSLTSKVSHWDAGILKEAEEGGRKTTSWIGYVGDEKKLTLPSLLTVLWSPEGYVEDLAARLCLVGNLTGNQVIAEMDFIPETVFMEKSWGAWARVMLMNTDLWLVKCILLFF